MLTIQGVHLGMQSPNLNLSFSPSSGIELRSSNNLKPMDEYKHNYT